MSEPDQSLDVLFVGGRLVDPSSSIDGLRNVGIREGSTTYVGEGRPDARLTVDITGRVLAPGFIDLHSHAQSPTGLLLQALDGVTTALDLEAGTLPIELQYRRAEEEGRPINFGFSASWAVARMHVLEGIPLPEDRADGPPSSAVELFLRNQRKPAWLGLAEDREIDEILALLEEGVDQGGIGIGVLLGYAPGSGRDEYFRIASRAERLGVPVFTHSRQLSNVEPNSSLDGALEVIGAAAGSGAAMHLCHINSTSVRRIDEIAAAIERAQTLGNRVTTEAYPYGAGSSGIGAAYLDPARLHRLGIGPKRIEYIPTREIVADEGRLRELRDLEPGGLCVITFLDEEREEDRRMLLRSFELPGTVIASDAMPLTRDGAYDIHDEWPIPVGALTHPRSAGTYAKTMRWLVRELGVFTLSEAIARCTIMPAAILEDSVPAMRRKGRVVVGADADLVVFDPDTISDAATVLDPRPSIGIDHVLVGGAFVVRDGRPVRGARPGKAVRSGR